jgi:hypothetical protein
MPENVVFNFSRQEIEYYSPAQERELWHLETNTHIAE